MNKIDFVNNGQPAINDTNLNQMQTNIENAINAIIVESGSNANGSYIKWSDGTMICTKRVSLSDIPLTATWGVLYDSGSTNIDLGNYAQSFVGENPILSLQVASANGCWVEGIYDNSLSHIAKIVLCSGTSKTVSILLDIIAIGRWK